MALPFARSVAQTRPTFSRDFAGLKTLDHGAGPAITFTRGSNATFFNAAGTLTTATTNEPRFDHDPATGASRGLLIEEARTNSIRNSQAGGSTDGVIGSGGALPLNWALAGTPSANGVATEITGSGTENGLSYIDVKFSGTPTSSSNLSILCESNIQIVAANGQTWTASMYYKLVAGSAANTTLRHFIRGSTDAGSQVNAETVFVTISPSVSTLSVGRHNVTRTFADATIGRTNILFNLIYTSGDPIDLTLRIAAPQLEQGAFPTSYIPTTTAAATRAADSAVVTPISSFYNGTEGTIFNEFSVPRLDGSGTLRGIAQFAEIGGVNNRLQNGVRGTGAHNFGAVASNVGEMTIESSAGAVTAGAVCKAAIVYKSGDSARSLNGASAATNSAALTQPTREVLRFGDVSTNGAAVLNGHIRKVAYYPRRLSNTLLQQLTT